MSTLAMEDKKASFNLMKKLADTEGNTSDYPECILMAPSDETLALFRERPDMQLAAKELANLLKAEAWVKKVTVEAFCDPDSDSEELSIDIEASISGREARQRLDVFVATQLPQSARQVEDELIFSVVEPNAA